MPDQSPCASHGEFRSSRASRIIDPPISLDLQIQNSTNKPSLIPRFWGKRPKEDGQTVRMVNESFHAPPGLSTNDTVPDNALQQSLFIHLVLASSNGTHLKRFDHEWSSLHQMDRFTRGMPHQDGCLPPLFSGSSLITRTPHRLPSATINVRHDLFLRYFGTLHSFLTDVKKVIPVSIHSPEVSEGETLNTCVGPPRSDFPPTATR